jgi:hypothetical protein
MSRWFVGLFAAGTGFLVLGAIVGAGSASAKVRWFHSPSGNIQCQVSANDARGNSAYCQTFERPQSVTLRRSGKMDLCRGIKCLGNGPEDAFTLLYGHSVRVGPFRCTSLKRGIRCRLIARRTGFLINRNHVRRF